MTSIKILDFGAASHISGSTEATVVKFCTHVGSIMLVVMGWQPIVGDLLNFWEVSDNNSKTMQDRDMGTMED